MAFVFGNQPSLGGQLGASFGTGLEALARQKLEQIQQRNLSNQLQQLIPGQQQQTSAIAALPENLQQTALKELLSTPGKQAYAQALGLGGGSAQEGFGNPIELGGLNERQASEIAKLQQKERHHTAKERAEAFKATKAERKEFVDKARAAKQNLQDLNRLEELEKEGLPSAGYNQFLKNAGLDIPALQGESGEEFNKISANFIKNARTYFGSRISNFELESFLKTIPTLSNSPIGRQRVISNLKNIARLEVEAGKLARDIIKKNKNTPPLDLMEKVEKKLDKKASKFAKKFKADLAKPVPPAQNKLLTAASSLLGNVAGVLTNPGTLLGGTLGGIYGGIPGAVRGATIGSLGQSALSQLLKGGR
jgi:hypothetical protein